MSYTYAPKTGATRAVRGRGGANRGRGRGTGTGSSPGTVVNPGGGDSSRDKTNPQVQDSPGAKPATRPPEDRMQRRDAYTVIVPDEKKRNAVQQQAKKETEQYERYKEEKKLGRVSYVGTVGGGQTTQATVRTTAQRDVKRAEFNRKAKSQHYREEAKRREQSEIDKKKAVQRKKAEQNQESDATRQRRLREEHMRTNEAFLARLEQNQQRPKANPHNSQQREPEDDLHEAAGATCMASEPQHSMEEPSDSSLNELIEAFPSYDPEYLEDILFQVNGNVDMAKNILSGAV